MTSLSLYDRAKVVTAGILKELSDRFLKILLTGNGKAFSGGFLGVLAICARIGLSLRGVLNCEGSPKLRRGLERLGDDRLWLLFCPGLTCRVDALKIMLLIFIIVQIFVD